MKLPIHAAPVAQHAAARCDVGCPGAPPLDDELTGYATETVRCGSIGWPRNRRPIDRRARMVRMRDERRYSLLHGTQFGAAELGANSPTEPVVQRLVQP